MRTTATAVRKEKRLKRAHENREGNTEVPCGLKKSKSFKVMELCCLFIREEFRVSAQCTLCTGCDTY